LFEFIEFGNFLGELFLGFVEFFPDKDLAFRLGDDCVLNFMELFEFRCLFVFDLFEVYFFASEFEDVEQPHFGDELGNVVRVVNDVVAQLASLQVLCYVGVGSGVSLLLFGQGLVLGSLVVHIRN
jgi:hypothetical protein